MLSIDNAFQRIAWSLFFTLFCVSIIVLYRYLSLNYSIVSIKLSNLKYTITSIPDFVVFTILTFFAGVRLNVGSDYYNYYIMFNTINYSDNLSDFIEYKHDGFSLLSYLLKQVSENEYIIFVAVAVILYGYFFYVIRCETKYKTASLICFMLLGFFAASLNILKQSIAMMLVICFYINLKNKNLLLSFFSAYLASLFHLTSLLPILVILVQNVIKVKPSKKLFYISVLLGVITMASLPYIISAIITLVPAAEGYNVYVNWRRNGQIRMIIAVTVSCLMYLILIVNILKYNTFSELNNPKRYYEITFLIIGIVINIAALRIWVIYRVALYFYQFIIFVLPEMIYSIDDLKTRNNFKKYLYILMLMYMLFSNIFLGDNEYYNYNTIFSGETPIYDADYNRVRR